MNPSKKLLNPLFQSNLSSDISHFIALNKEVFAELLTFIDFAEKFTIGFVEVNFSSDISILIESLKINPACRHIQFCNLEFFDADLRFLRDEIIKILPTIQIEKNKKLVLTVRGLEKSIGVFGDYPPVLQDLNFVRDAYKRTVPHPILFILPDYAISRLAKFAPDFWAWRSGVFRFHTTQITKEYAIAQTLNSDQTIDRLQPPEKQERIDLLDRLLMEYRPTGHQATGENLRNCSNILHQLGVAYLSQRNSIKAREYLEEAAKIAKSARDSLFQAEILNTLGESYYQQRQFDKAITFYQESLSISQKLENHRGEIASLYKLGNVYLELRQFQQANTLYHTCLEIEQQISDRYSSASTYHHLGMVAQELRKFEEARRYYQQALEITIEFGDRYSSARTYHQLGRVAQELREFEEARRYYQQALEIKIEFGDRYSSASIYHALGLLAEAQENYTEARSNLQKALEIDVEYNDEYWATIVRKVLERLPK